MTTYNDSNGNNYKIGSDGILNISIGSMGSGVIPDCPYVSVVFLIGISEAIESIKITNRISRIGNCAFYIDVGGTVLNPLKNVTMYDSEIGDYAFDGCNNLESVTIYATTPNTVGVNAFPSTTKIYVPVSSVDAYKSAWPSYASQIKALVSDQLYDTSIEKITTQANVGNALADRFIGCRANLYAVTVGSETTQFAYVCKGAIIKCNVGDTFSLRSFGSIDTSRTYIAEYDSDFKVLAKSTYDSTGDTYTVTEQNAHYLCIEWSIDATDDAKMMIVKGSNIPEEYQPYSPAAKSKYDPVMAVILGIPIDL